MAYSMTREQNVFLAKRNIVDSIYRESRLEGINITFPQTQEIYDGRVAAGLSVDDTVTINNLKHAWHFILENLDEPLDLGFLCKIHALVGAGQVLDAGSMRNGSVGIAGTDWRPPVPSAEIAEGILNSVAAPQSNPDAAMLMFADLARAQLFWDGNKRTAQLAANKVLIENGLGIFTVPVDLIAEFNELCIEFYDSGDADSLASFLCENCIQGIDF